MPAETTSQLPAVDLHNVIPTMRTRLLVMIAAMSTVASELDTVDEILRNPAPTAKVDHEAIEASLREAIDAGMLLPDQTEEMLGVLESMVDIVRAKAGEGSQP